MAQPATSSVIKVVTKLKGDVIARSGDSSKCAWQTHEPRQSAGLLRFARNDAAGAAGFALRMTLLRSAGLLRFARNDAAGAAGFALRMTLLAQRWIASLRSQ